VSEELIKATEKSGEREAMLTTSDNPHSPFTEFEDWLAFDTRHGYNTLPYLARVMVTSSEISDPDQSLAIGQAIDEIIFFNLLGIYKKVYEDEETEIDDV